MSINIKPGCWHCHKVLLICVFQTANLVFTGQGDVCSMFFNLFEPNIVHFTVSDIQNFKQFLQHYSENVLFTACKFYVFCISRLTNKGLFLLSVCPSICQFICPSHFHCWSISVDDTCSLKQESQCIQVFVITVRCLK